MKVLTVFGTRPEAIKLAPIIRELECRTHEGNLQSIVCVTAQHRHMLDQILSLFGIVPHYDLNVMHDNQSPTQVAAAVLSKLEPILESERPDWVLVQGDTTTVAAAALAAFYSGVRIGHVEAGLRTFDKHQPFPEEINRRVTSVIADMHFAPTGRARANLLHEGIPDATIHITGNPVIDALRMMAALPDQAVANPVNDLPPDRRLILVTAHRRENLGEPLKQICLALRDIVQAYADIHIVYPVHLNPNVRAIVYGLLDDMPQITLTEPLDYWPFIQVMKRAMLILTDSGGIQEEAPGLGKPVLVLREVTERPEAVEAGTVRVVGTDRARIVEATQKLLDDPAEYDRMARAVNPYGDGHAAKRIVDLLVE